MYWNIAGDHDNLTLALNNEPGYDALALSELPTGDRGMAAPSGSRYQLVYFGGQAALYVHKKYSGLEARGGNNWAAARLNTAEGPIEVYSIYAPNPGLNRDSPLTTLIEHSPSGYDLVVGDFNTHHPAWDREGRLSPHAGETIDLAQRWGLELATPWGEITRIPRGEQNHRDSTIDLAWASPNLRAEFAGRADLVGGDHFPQVVRIPRGHTPELGQPQKGYSWALMDRNRVEAEAEANIRIERDLLTKQDIDTAALELLDQLHVVAERSTPQRKHHGGSKAPWWNNEVREAVIAMKVAHRTYVRERTELHWEELTQARNRQKKAISRARQAYWRRLLDDATDDSRKAWAIAKWARTQSHLPAQTAAIPPLANTEGGPPAAHTYQEKAQLFAERFFPDEPADLSDITDDQFDPPSFPPNSVPVNQRVDADDVAYVLRNMSAWKAPGFDLLPAGFLKACGTPLHEALAKLADASFRHEHFPRCFRAARTAVIPKPGKTNEQRATAGAWRPVALLSTVGKVLEAIIGQRIANAAEEHRLLPEGQMGNRRGRSTELAVRMVVEAARAA